MKLRHVSCDALLALPALPRISPDEDLLIREWLLATRHSYVDYSIDLPVGAGATSHADAWSVIERMWAAITRRRVDVVAFSDRRVDIVEAKVRATMRTVTQVTEYCREYENEHCTPWRVRPVIICRSAVLGVEPLLRSRGGLLLEFPAIAASRGDASPQFAEEHRHG